MSLKDLIHGKRNHSTLASLASLALADTENSKTTPDKPGNLKDESDTIANDNSANPANHKPVILPPELIKAATRRFSYDAEELATVLDDLTYYAPESWPWLTDYFNDSSEPLAQTMQIYAT